MSKVKPDEQQNDYEVDPNDMLSPRVDALSSGDDSFEIAPEAITSLADVFFQQEQRDNGLRANDGRWLDFDNTRRFIDGHDDIKSRAGKVVEEREITYSNHAKNNNRPAVEIEVKGDEVTLKSAGCEKGYTLKGDKKLADEVFATLSGIAADGKISRAEEKQLDDLEAQLKSKTVKQAMKQMVTEGRTN